METIQKWAEQHLTSHDGEYECIYSTHSSYRGLLSITPTKKIKNTFLSKKTLKESHVRIIVCEKNAFDATYSEAQALHTVQDKEQWFCVFASPYVEVWESIQDTLLKPLRNGCSQSEKECLLAYARATLVQIQSQAYQENLNVLKSKDTLDILAFTQRFSQVATVDVTLWVRGELRGSQIVEGKSCLEAVYEATLRAREDARFKPVMSEEYNEVRIELTIMHDLHIPLTETELNQDEIYCDKAHSVISEDRRSWYVPAVFNCRTFPNLEYLRNSLLYEKARMQKGVLKTVFICEVIDCIESIGKDRALTLHGPVLKSDEYTSKDENAEGNNLPDSRIARVRIALDHIVRIQDADGSFPVTVSPFVIERPRIDWVRSACLLSGVAMSLKAFSELQNNLEYMNLVEKGYRFLRRHLYTNRTMDAQTRCMSLLYHHEVVQFLGEDTEIERSHVAIVDSMHMCGYNPILYTQLGRHFLAYRGATEKEKLEARKFGELVLKDFDVKKSEGVETLDLASYADLPNLLTEISSIGSDECLKTRGEEIFNWFLENQNSDGSFPARIGSSYRYTRGTGKVLEALSRSRITRHDRAYQKAIVWLHSMQYQKESVYFVHRELQEKIIGGFRHDHHNATLWIDSVVHYLIALSNVVTIAEINSTTVTN